MHSITLKVYNAEKKAQKTYASKMRNAGILNRSREWVKHIDRAAHYHVSAEVMRDATDHFVNASGFPQIARLPAKNVVVTCGGVAGAAVFFWEICEDSGSWGCAIAGLSSGISAVVPIGGAIPGGGFGAFINDDLTEVEKAGLSMSTDGERKMVIGALAFVWASLGRPGASSVRIERGNFLHRAKVRKARGSAPSAWTVIDRISYGRSPLLDRRAAKSAGGVLALHRRIGHWAWVPSQRRTKKAVWLDQAEAGPRGAGWYVRRPERMIGTDAAGVKCSRNNVRSLGEQRSPFPDAPEEMQQERAEALAAAQRAMMVQLGYAPSAALH